jgi:V8-like Glu-specific endopeptidase
MAMSRGNMGKQITRPGKVKKVMHEFKVNTLKSSSGKPVTKKSQAVAIALSEARRPRRTRRPKKV